MDHGAPPGGPSADPEIGPGVRLRLPLPAGARDEAPDALPAVDLSAIPSARVTLRRGVQAEGLRLRALCAAARSDRWAPGAEELVLDRASSLARAAVPGAVDRWDAGQIRAVTGGGAALSGEAGQRFEQRFEGTARDGGGALSIRGWHLLGFAGQEREAILCTLICTEPAQAPSPRCAAALDAATVEGSFAPPPPPGLLARSILFAAEHPYPAAGSAALLAVACVALLLAHRPRPRPW